MSALRPSRLILAGLILATAVLGPGAPAMAAGARPTVVVVPVGGGEGVNARLIDPDAPGLG